MQDLKQSIGDRQGARQALSYWQRGLMALGGMALVAAVPLVVPAVAQAQAAYGSYVGAGVGFGVTRGGDDEPSKTAALVALRYKFLKAPLSIRTQALIGDATAIVPTISYDIPLNWRTDAYIGVGASIPVSGDRTTPVGNQTSFAIQPGIDYVMPNSSLVLFGNAIIAFDAYRNGSGAAASFQGGVGLRF